MKKLKQLWYQLEPQIETIKRLFDKTKGKRAYIVGIFIPIILLVIAFDMPSLPKPNIGKTKDKTETSSQIKMDRSFEQTAPPAAINNSIFWQNHIIAQYDAIKPLSNMGSAAEHSENAISTVPLLNEKLKNPDLLTDKAWYNYQQLSEINGRTQITTALITHDAVKAVQKVERPDFPSTTIVAGERTPGKLSKFPTVTWKKEPGSKSNNMDVKIKTENSEYNGWLFNKSHLIAWSLGGSMESNNVIWGTRYQNVGSNNSKAPGGMSAPETIVRDYIHKTPSAKVIYVAAPVYDSPEDIVPAAVYVEALDTQQPDNLHIAYWTTNTQDGVTIDYQTGIATLQ